MLAEPYSKNHKGGVAMKLKELSGGIDIGSEFHHVSSDE